MYRTNIPVRNETLFFRSLVIIDQKKNRFLNVVPPFREGLTKYDYEIYGNDDTRVENTVICRKNLLSKQIITFNCKLGATYFIKILARYDVDSEEFFHFYKMEDDFEEDIKMPLESFFDKNDQPRTTFIIPKKKQDDNQSDNTDIENITDVDVVNHQENEENKITNYITTRTPGTGLEIDCLDQEFRDI